LAIIVKSGADTVALVDLLPFPGQNRLRGFSVEQVTSPYTGVLGRERQAAWKTGCKKPVLQAALPDKSGARHGLDPGQAARVHAAGDSSTSVVVHKGAAP